VVKKFSKNKKAIPHLSKSKGTKVQAPSLQELLEVAMEAAVLAGRRTLAYFNTPIAVETKADRTPVTCADREAEQLIRERILRSYPRHSILGEEHGEQTGNQPYRWIIDPIDGTKAFIHGVPLYGVLIGVEVYGEVRVGVIYLPALQEMVAAASGLGCFWNGRRTRVSNVSQLENAALLTSSVASAMARSDAYERLVSQTKLQRTWGDSYGYALVATGRAEIMLDARMNVWDCAPMLPILEEAGGRFSNWKGERTIWGKEAVATNRILCDEVIQVLKSEKIKVNV
jgi:histidinol phosphatase-like enzyme (inositol monophosphatase family)